MKQLQCKFSIACKHFIVCIIALCCATTLHAQIAFGAKGGATFAYQTLSDGASGWKNGYHAGVALNIYIVEYSFGGFAVQPEIIYNNRGATVQVLDQSQHWEDKVEKLGYIDIPLGLIYLLNFGDVIPYISVAPYYSFLLSQKSEFRGEDTKVDYYRGSDYGVKLGGGVELRRFQISAAYSLGLCDISKKSGQTAYNRSVEVSLGYFLQ